MRRLLVTLCLLAIPTQVAAVRPAPEPSLAESRSDLALAAVSPPATATIVVRRVSPLEPLPGQEAGCLNNWRCELAGAKRRLTTLLQTNAPLASHDSLQSQSVRWQI